MRVTVGITRQRLEHFQPNLAHVRRKREEKGNCLYYIYLKFKFRGILLQSTFSFCFKKTWDTGKGKGRGFGLGLGVVIGTIKKNI